MPKYVPPHLRKSSRTPEKANSASRWQGERPTSSGASSSRPSSSDSALGRSTLLQAHGDSFVGPLKLLQKVVDVYRYSGATAKGLWNSKSEQQVGRKLVECLDKTRPETILLQFGNVDINISSVYRLETKGADGWDEKQFVADVWDPYEAFLRAHILTRLQIPHGYATHLDDPPKYIRRLYICQATLPVVGDEALPESHAKYQYPKKKDGDKERSAAEEEELQRQARSRMERVRPLIQLCGIEARRRMTEDFNARLGKLALSLGSCAEEIHVVNLNRYIRKSTSSNELAAPFITKDPVGT
ncbi:unnamed protein product [Discula destructiva]